MSVLASVKGYSCSFLQQCGPSNLTTNDDGDNEVDDDDFDDDNDIEDIMNPRAWSVHNHCSGARCFSGLKRGPLAASSVSKGGT